MARKTHHILPNQEGGWKLKAGGADRATKIFPTKKEAEDYGRKVSQNQKSEFIIHGKDGKIQRADSHGNDPNPPKDSR